MQLDEWPVKFRSILKTFMNENHYTQLKILEDVSGASGARTYLALPKTEHGIGNPLVIKLGQKMILEKDHQGLELAQKHFYGANLEMHKMIEQDGISCLSMQLVGTSVDGNIIPARSFASFYMALQDPQEIVPCVKRLFKDVLQQRRNDVERNPFNVFELHKLYDPEVMSRELGKVDDVRPTLAYWWEKAGTLCESHSFTAIQHGDLHSQNVIVDAENRISVIDYGRTDSLHIMRDFAKFDREIRLVLYLKESHDLEGDYQALKDALTLEPNDERRENNPRLQKACLAIETLNGLAAELLPAVENWKFEYDAALLAQFIFAASNSMLDTEIRKIALYSARDLIEKLAKEHDFTVPIDVEAYEYRRKGMLWRTAYAFLRLDQLPSGGWSKSLASWMEALWEGDSGEIERNRGMRTSGGTDLTCYAFYHYCTLLDRIHPNLEDQLRNYNQVAASFKENLRERIGFEGGIGVGRSVRGGNIPVPVRIRHTAMAVIGFLLYGRYPAAGKAEPQLEETIDYLLKYIKNWKDDKSHYFGTYAAFVKLLDLISRPDMIEPYPLLAKKGLFNNLIDSITEILPHLLRELTSSDRYSPRPKGLFNNDLGCAPFFIPYHRFWRMKRANFIMYFPFLLKDDGVDFIDAVDTQMRMRCKEGLVKMMNDIKSPFDPEYPAASLVCYHQDPIHYASKQKDWGLSAELAAVLEFPATKTLLIEGDAGQEGFFSDKKEALGKALFHTFDGYYNYPEIFKFTHGTSFSRYLNTVANQIDPDEMRQIDRVVENMIKDGVTEGDLDNLMKIMLNRVKGKAADVDSRALITMLVHKLESGEYTPDVSRCLENTWNNRINRMVTTTTVSFYDGQSGMQYCDHYQKSPIHAFVDRIDELTGWETFQDKMAIDVGCGPGQYAKLLQDKGYKVELLDSSTVMLREASILLGLPGLPPPKSIYDLDTLYPDDESFDLIFACAVMIHVPKSRAAEIYRSFYRLLKPGGILFVSFKIGDHSFICEGGRFFEYYGHYAVPLKEIETIGFECEEIILRWNKQNRFRDPMKIHWANFFFTKPTYVSSC